VYGRGLGILVTILLMSILIVALTLPSMGKNFVAFLELHMNIPVVLMVFLSYGRWVVLMTFFFLILGMIYSWLPNIHLKFQEVIPGVIFTMLGWMCLSVGFSYFVQYFSNISFVYGSLGTVITLMIWLYFIGMLIMLGSELNAILIKWHESNL
jgi:membrane protein